MLVAGFPVLPCKRVDHTATLCFSVQCVLLMVGVGLVVQDEKGMCTRRGEARSHRVRTSHELCLVQFPAQTEFSSTFHHLSNVRWENISSFKLARCTNLSSSESVSGTRL